MPHTPDQGGLGIKEMMGSAIGTSTERYARHLGSRLTAAESGRPLKRGDDDPTKLAKLGNEFKAFSGMELADLQKKVETYRLPKEPIVDQKGEYDARAVQELATVLAAAKPNRITDLSKLGQFTIERGRVSFKGDATTEDTHQTVSYDLERLANAVLASHEIQEVYEGLRDIQYPHVDKDGKIESKTLLVLSREAAKQLETALAQVREVKEFKEKVPEKPKKVEIAEQKRERAVRECKRLIDIAKARLQVYEGGDKPEKPGKEYTFSDLPESVQDKIEEQLKQFNEKRERQGLPTIFFDPSEQSRLQDFAKHSFPTHARGLRGSIDSMRHARIWAVSTEKTATAKSGEYDPSELVMVLAHPREAIRDLTRLREDIQKGDAEWPARVITLVEDFAEGVERFGMPGDPKKV